MAEIINEEEEKKLEVRLRSRRHIRAILIVVNLLLIGYLFYFTIDAVTDYFQKRDEDFVALNHLSSSKSKKKYEELFQVENEKYEEFYQKVLGKLETNGDTLEEGVLSSTSPVAEPLLLGDYALYGTYLHISEEQFDLPTYTPLENICLVRLDEKETTKIPQTSLLGKSLNEGISLSSLTSGDYLLAKEESYEYRGESVQLLHYIQIVVSKNNHEDSIYSFPSSEDGLRKEIHLYAYPKNPCFVIKVREFNSLPKDNYDFVLRGSKENQERVEAWVKELNQANPKLKLKYKFFDENESLASLYQVKTSVAIDIRGVEEGTLSSILNSSYLKDLYVQDTQIEEGKLAKMDQDDFIRELGGYPLKAGARVKDIPHSYDVVSYQGEHDVGKMAFVIRANGDDVLIHMQEIIDMFFNQIH